MFSVRIFSKDAIPDKVNLPELKKIIRISN